MSNISTVPLPSPTNAIVLLAVCIVKYLELNPYAWIDLSQMEFVFYNLRQDRRDLAEEEMRSLVKEMKGPYLKQFNDFQKLCEILGMEFDNEDA